MPTRIGHPNGNSASMQRLSGRRLIRQSAQCRGCYLDQYKQCMSLEMQNRKIRIRESGEIVQGKGAAKPLTYLPVVPDPAESACWLGIKGRLRVRNAVR